MQDNASGACRLEIETRNKKRKNQEQKAKDDVETGDNGRKGYLD